MAFVATLGVALMFSRLSTPQRFGEYQYVNTLLGVMMLFALPGMVVAVTRASALGAGGTLWAGTVDRLRFSGLGVAGLLGIGLIFAGRGEPGLAQAAAVAGIGFPFVAALDTYFAYLAGRREFPRYALLQVAQTVAPLPVMLLVLRAGRGVAAAVMANVGMTGLVNLFGLWAELRRIGPDAPVDVEGLRYGRRVSGVYVIGSIHTHVAALTVGTLLGPVSLAVFSIGLLCAEVFRQAIALANLQLFPSMAALDDRSSRRLLRRSLSVGLPAVAVAALVAVVILPVAVPLLFTAQYRESVLYAQLLVATMVLAFPGNQVNNFLAARAQVPAQYALAASSLIVEIAAVVGLASVWGLLGAAIGKGVMRLWYSAYGWWLVTRREDA